MPTGYTADVQDGKVTTLKDYALSCARAFGALIHMRDEPADAPIVEDKESDYYANSLRSARQELVELKAMTKADIAKAFAEHKAEQEQKRREYVARVAEQKERYETMLAKVNAWEPPTADHVGLKEFMASQLTQSIDFDCKVYEDLYAVEGTAEEWYARRLESVEKGIAYATKRKAEEAERVRSRNKWIADLKASLVNTTAERPQEHDVEKKSQTFWFNNQDQTYYIGRIEEGPDELKKSLANYMNGEFDMLLSGDVDDISVTIGAKVMTEEEIAAIPVV